MEGLMRAPYDATVRQTLASLERNLLPDAVIRRLTRCSWLADFGLVTDPPLNSNSLTSSISLTVPLREMPVAISTDKPKTQHYELPTSFFKLVLGKNFKYSCCYFSDGSKTLEDAEEAMLELYWITSYIADISTFEMDASYDRIYSIEMFEHMKNYHDLLKKIAKWMKQGSLLFVHYFCHKAFAYHFEDLNEDDWMTRYFFTGGTMPSANLLPYFQDDVSVVNHWLVNGKHYAQTSKEWLKRMDQNSASIKPIMEATYGKDQAVKWNVYWRTFFIAGAELFGYNNGEEWMVALFLFKKK
ncbi:hypothetical protein DITRI_Ditri10aG0174100 [Diplodiscus trichospermus]